MASSPKNLVPSCSSSDREDGELSDPGESPPRKTLKTLSPTAVRPSSELSVSATSGTSGSRKASISPAEASVVPEEFKRDVEVEKAKRVLADQSVETTASKRLREASPIERHRPTPLVVQIPKRPDEGGTLGRPVDLLTNHFIMRIETQGDLVYHQYDVEIIEKRDQEMRVQPERMSKARKQEESERNYKIFKEMEKRTGKLFERTPLAYDKQKLLITRSELDLGPDGKAFNIQNFKLRSGFERDFVVRLRKVATICLENINDIPEDSARKIITPINAIDLILKQSQYTNDSFMTAGKSLYKTRYEQDLGLGKVLHKGISLSARPIQAGWKDMKVSGKKTLKLSLNVDVVNSAFYKTASALDVVKDILNVRDFRDIRIRPGDREFDRVSKELKKRRFQTIESFPVFRGFKPRGLHRTSARTEMLEKPGRNGEMVQLSLEEYYRQQYKIQLKFPELPLLFAQKLSKYNILYPLELCEVSPEQRVPNSELNGDQLQKIIRTAALPPPQKQKETLQLLKESGVTKDKTVRDFGLKIDNDMMELKGRILQPPNVSYNNGSKVTPRDGKWDMRQSRFLESGRRLDCWVIMVCCGRMNNRNAEREIEDFARELTKFSRNVGMDMRDAKDLLVVENERIGEAMVQCQNKYGNSLELIMCIIQRKGDFSYSIVKQQAEIHCDIMTQCVTLGTIKKGLNPRGGSMTLGNILMKINGKMDGVNNSLEITSASWWLRSESNAVMYMGADVTHPMAGTRAPSVAAVVSNLENGPVKYAASISVQQARKEVITDLEKMSKTALRNFYTSSNKRKPGHIFMFRDGVSEGQFQEVLQYELSAIRNACTSLENGYEPKITFVVVQKRHHTRFFPKHEPRGNNKNIEPGTVVDTDVVTPSEYDFFLCSHQGIQGTSKPTHYHVLHDDNDLKSNDMQSLTYQLCHVYARCTRSVSIPAPCYYAHLAAFRAREHLKSNFETVSQTSGGSGSFEIDPLKLKEMQDQVTLKKGLKKRMYFI